MELRKAQQQVREEAEKAKFMEEFSYSKEQKTVPTGLEFQNNPASAFDSAEMDLMMQRERFEIERQDQLKAKRVDEEKKKKSAQEKGREEMAEWRKYLLICDYFRKKDAEIQGRKEENKKKQKMRTEEGERLLKREGGGGDREGEGKRK